MSNAEATTPSVRQSRWSPKVKWSALVLGIFFIAFYLLRFFAQDQYTAEAYLSIKQPEPMLPSESAADIDPRQQAFFKSRQVVMIRTPFVLSAALRRPTVAELPFVGELKEPVEWLQRKLQVEFDDGTEVVRLSLQCPDKDAAVAILNAVLEAYMDEVVIYDRNERLSRLDRLERSHAEVEGKIRKKRFEMRHLEDALGLSAAEVPEHYLLEQLSSLIRREERLETRLADLEMETTLLTEKRKSTVEGDQDAREPEYDMSTELQWNDMQTQLLSNRLGALKQSREQILESIAAAKKVSLDVEFMESEVVTLKKIAGELSEHISRTHLNLSMHSGVNLLEPARIAEREDWTNWGWIREVAWRE